MEISEKAKKLYERAKTQILYQSPFFGSLMLQCQHIWTDQIPTMATNGRDLLFNPSFVEQLTDQELQGCIVHELCHKIFLHHIRGKQFEDKMRYNIACDYALNPVVVEAGFKLPAGTLIDSKYEGMTADEIYKLLSDQSNQPNQSNQSGQHPGGIMGTDHTLPGEGSASNNPDEIEREVKIQVAAAAAQAKFAGKLPGSIQKLVDEYAETKVDWKAALAEFIQDSISGDDDLTFRRPNRRMLAHDLYLPSTQGTKMPPMAIMFDTSGSIYSYQDVVEQFVAEIRSIIEHAQPEALHVLYVDTQVQGHDVYDNPEDFEVNLKGGGGTSFDSAFRYINELDEHRPHVLICMTDLYVDTDNLETSIPTMWITYGFDTGSEPPFGRVLNITAN